MLSCRLQSSDSSSHLGSAAIVSAKESPDREQHKYEENIRHKILEAALPFVHEFGWSKNAISAGEIDCFSSTDEIVYLPFVISMSDHR